MKKEIKQKQSKMKPLAKSPELERKQTDRGDEQPRKRSIPDCCSEPFSEPNDKTSRFDVSGAAFSQRTSAVTQHPPLLKQEQEETNRVNEGLDEKRAEEQKLASS